MSASGSSNLFLENDFFRIGVKEKGAELCSVFSKELNTELLWQAHSAWPKHAPVLFPVVGQLKDNLYQFNGKQYSLPRHGFARDRIFRVNEVSNTSLSLILSHDELTINYFPFHFLFKVRYELLKDELRMTITVKNSGENEMYYSYGAHPAFRVPLSEGENFELYELQFGAGISRIERWPLKDNLISDRPKLLNTFNGILPLNRKLFSADAIVIKRPEFSSVAIVHRENGKGLKMDFGNWPFFGIWSAPGGDFICLEPWQGIADTVLSTGKLVEKEGILCLPADGSHSSSFSIRTVQVKRVNLRHIS